MSPREDFYDAATLAREHLENAAALFAAIGVMKETGLYDTEIRHLARAGRYAADRAAEHFDEVAAELMTGQESGGSHE